MVILGKWKYQTLRTRTFHGLFFVNQRFVWPGFSTDFLSFTYITRIKNEIYLIFVKLKNIGQIKSISYKYRKKFKRPPFSANFASDLKLSGHDQFDKVFVKIWSAVILFFAAVIDYDNFLQNYRNNIPRSTAKNLKTPCPIFPKLWGVNDLNAFL